MSTSKQAKKISESEVQGALERFRQKGGLIRRLPDQVAPSRVIASGRGGYESIEALLAGIEPNS